MSLNSGRMDGSNGGNNTALNGSNSASAAGNIRVSGSQLQQTAWENALLSLAQQQQQQQQQQHQQHQQQQSQAPATLGTDQISALLGNKRTNIEMNPSPIFGANGTPQANKRVRSEVAAVGLPSLAAGAYKPSVHGTMGQDASAANADFSANSQASASFGTAGGSSNTSQNRQSNENTASQKLLERLMGLGGGLPMPKAWKRAIKPSAGNDSSSSDETSPAAGDPSVSNFRNNTNADSSINPSQNNMHPASGSASKHESKIDAMASIARLKGGFPMPALVNTTTKSPTIQKPLHGNNDQVDGSNNGEGANELTNDSLSQDHHHNKKRTQADLSAFQRTWQQANDPWVKKEMLFRKLYGSPKQPALQSGIDAHQRQQQQHQQQHRPMR